MKLQKFTLSEKQKFDEIFGNKKQETEIEKKFYKKTEKYLKFIKWIPGLKMIGIGNSISMNCATKDSDIDLLIVTDKNRMWLVRILVTFIFQILGVRKTEKNHAGRFCLSFFCEIEGLDFSNFALEKDPYLYIWILYFKPILDYGNTYNLFLEKNKSWADFGKFEDILEENKKFIKYSRDVSPDTSDNLLKMFLPNISTSDNILKIFLPNISTSYNIFKMFQRNISTKLNNFFKKIFLPKTLKHYNKIGKPYGIIISDKMLKFHNGDIRKKIAEKF